MFAHAAYVVIDGFRRLGRGPVPLRVAQRMAVATTLIAWLAYYFNGPNWWQIWTHLFLYGFLVMGFLDRRRFGIARGRAADRVQLRWRRMRLAPASFVLLLFLALLIPHTNRHLLQYGKDFLRPQWLRAGGGTAMVSGVLMPKGAGEQLVRKAAKLKELHALAKGSLVYLTFNVAFMPVLTRLFQTMPYSEMLGQIAGEPGFREAIDKLLARKPDIILVDAPNGPLAVTGVRKDYQDRIRAAISVDYRLADTADGWQIWRPSGAR